MFIAVAEEILPQSGYEAGAEDADKVAAALQKLSTVEEQLRKWSSSDDSTTGIGEKSGKKLHTYNLRHK